MVLIALTHHMHHHHRTQVEHANHMGGFTQTLGNTIPNILQEMMDILEDRLLVHLTTPVVHHHIPMAHIMDHLLEDILMVHIMDHLLEDHQVVRLLECLPMGHQADHQVDHP